MRWTFNCSQTQMLAAASAQAARAATHLISPWKVRQMPQIIVGLPLDRTPPRRVFPCWLSEALQVRSVRAAGIYRRMWGVRGTGRKLVRSDWLWPAAAGWERKRSEASLSSSALVPLLSGAETLRTWIQSHRRCIDAAVECLAGWVSTAVLSLNIMFIKRGGVSARGDKYSFPYAHNTTFVFLVRETDPVAVGVPAHFNQVHLEHQHLFAKFAQIL